MTKIARLVAILCSLQLQFAEASELEAGKLYRTSAVINVSDGSSTNKNGSNQLNFDIPVGSQSKFRVVSSEAEGSYAIQFVNVYKVQKYSIDALNKSSCENTLNKSNGKTTSQRSLNSSLCENLLKAEKLKQLCISTAKLTEHAECEKIPIVASMSKECSKASVSCPKLVGIEGVLLEESKVVEGRIYYLSKDDVNGVKIEDYMDKSLSGLSSGALIVPFKYRLDDKSIGGEATVGMYAGVGFDSFDISGVRLNIMPFLSVGLTQVTVTSLDDEGNLEEDTKTGITWSTGLLIQNWDQVNIGLVYGQDRVGDSSWTHEGKGWLSLSVGWEL